jgi:hypothetical protein
LVSDEGFAERYECRVGCGLEFEGLFAVFLPIHSDTLYVFVFSADNGFGINAFIFCEERKINALLLSL